MSRNLKQQFNYCIYQCDHRGTSKRADRMNGSGTKNKVYSHGRIDDLKDLASAFNRYMREHHPEVRMVDQVTSEHVQEYIDSKKDKWSAKTESENISRFHKLNELTNHVYGRSNTWVMHTNEREVSTNIRDKAMTREDYKAINNSLQEKRTEAKYAMEITARTGLRIAEVAGLKVSGIRTDKWVVEVREGSKGGRWRDVPIREADRNYFANLKEEMEAKGRVYVTNGVKSQSLDKAIRREMKELGLSDKYVNTTDHAIRKMYARERMAEERPRSKSEVEAWEKVQQELGHGDESREALYRTYVGGNLV